MPRKRHVPKAKHSSLLDVTVLVDSFALSSWSLFMKPLTRSSVSKGRSAAQFRGNIGRVKAANIRVGLARGGIRL